MSQPAIGYLARCRRDDGGVKALLRYVYQTDNALTFRCRAPASCRDGVSVRNLVRGRQGHRLPQRRFRRRMIENVERCGGVAVVVDDAWGHPSDPQKVEDPPQES